MGDYLLVGQILRSPLTPYEVSTLAVNTRSLHQPYQEKSMKFLELGLSRPSIWYPICQNRPSILQVIANQPIS
jgi:hypothetical protein